MSILLSDLRVCALEVSDFPIPPWAASKGNNKESQISEWRFDLTSDVVSLIQMQNKLAKSQSAPREAKPRIFKQD